MPTPEGLRSHVQLKGLLLTPEREPQWAGKTSDSAAWDPPRGRHDELGGLRDTHWKGCRCGPNARCPSCTAWALCPQLGQCTRVLQACGTGLAPRQRAWAQLAQRPLAWCRQNVRLQRGWAHGASEGRAPPLLLKGQLPSRPAGGGGRQGGRGGWSCQDKQGATDFVPERTTGAEQEGSWV